MPEIIVIIYFDAAVWVISAVLCEFNWTLSAGNEQLCWVAEIKIFVYELVTGNNLRFRRHVYN